MLAIGQQILTIDVIYSVKTFMKLRGAQALLLALSAMREHFD
jgi:hypothetical protein